mgnify:CR=1 FL=1
MITLPNDSVVAIHDLFDPLPGFMLEADTIFTDIPYTQGLLTNYAHRPGVKRSPANTGRFSDFIQAFFERLEEIAPATLFVEVGKGALADVYRMAEARFEYVTFYNATYYHKVANKSYIIHATNDRAHRRYPALEDMDEEDAIAWICANHPYRCIGDLCMGKGLVGKHAYLNGRRFVGTELNGWKRPDALRGTMTMS